MENKSVELYSKYSSTTNWISKKQYTVALSSTKAEFKAAIKNLNVKMVCQRKFTDA